MGWVYILSFQHYFLSVEKPKTSVIIKISPLINPQPYLPPFLFQLGIDDPFDLGYLGIPAVVWHNVLEHQVALCVKLRTIRHHGTEGLPFFALSLQVLGPLLGAVPGLVNGLLLQLKANQAVGAVFGTFSRALVTTGQLLSTGSFTLHVG